MRQINIFINDITTDIDNELGNKRLSAALGVHSEILIPRNSFYEYGSVDILTRYEYQLANNCLRKNIDTGDFEQQFDLFKKKLLYMLRSECAGEALKIIDELREDLRIDFKIVKK